MVKYGHIAHQTNCLNEAITNLVLFFLYVDWFLRYPARRNMFTHQEICSLCRLFAFLSDKSLWNCGSLVLKLISTMRSINPSNAIFDYILTCWKNLKSLKIIPSSLTTSSLETLFSFLKKTLFQISWHDNEWICIKIGGYICYPQEPIFNRGQNVKK